jgi:hypothetical protein
MDARIKKRHDLTAVWVYTGKVRSLMKVTVVAGKGKILLVIGTTMLLGNDVLDVQCRLVVCLMNQAILAPVPRPMSDKRTSGGVH